MYGYVYGLGLFGFGGKFWMYYLYFVILNKGFLNLC